MDFELGQGAQFVLCYLLEKLLQPILPQHGNFVHDLAEKLMWQSPQNFHRAHFLLDDETLPQQSVDVHIYWGYDDLNVLLFDDHLAGQNRNMQLMVEEQNVVGANLETNN